MSSFSKEFRQSAWNYELGEPPTVREIISSFYKHVIKYKSALFWAAFAFFIAASVQSLIPIAVKFVIDNIIPMGNINLLWATAGVLGILFLLRMVIGILGYHMLIYTSTHVVFDVRSRMFEHLQLLHLAFFEREQSGKLVAKIINDASALQMLIQSALPILSVNIFQIAVAFTLMFVLSPPMTLFAMIVLPLYVFVSYFFKTRLYRRAMEVRERSSVVAGNVNEVITGIKVVKSFGMEDEEQKRFVRMIRENLDYEIDLGATNAIRTNSLEFISNFARAAIILLGGMFVISTKLTLGSFVAFMSFLMMLFHPMQQIASLAIQSIHARTGLERILQILNIKPKVVDKPHAKAVEKLNGLVIFDDVTFSYRKKYPVLHNISFDAQPGEVVALVGPSGAGKSTIVNLLTRFYDPDKGRILIDTMDLRDLKLKSYRNRVGIVLQEPFLFSGTIHDNICYGKGQATREEVEEAARQANALDFIGEMSEGMDTQVGERGTALSGGQRQRISIARALLKDPDILILDEATSSLDTHSERLVQQALDRLMQGRTVFVIAHRLSTIRSSDKIVVLKQGRIEEIGSHDDLIIRDGLYSSLYKEDLTFTPLEPVFEESEELYHNGEFYEKVKKHD